MLENIFMPIIQWLLIAIVIVAGRIQNPITQGLAKLSSTFRNYKETTLTKDRQWIIQIAGDGYLLVIEFVWVAILFMFTSLLLLMSQVILYVSSPWWGREFFSVIYLVIGLLGLLFTSHHIDLAKQARELYLEEKQLAVTASDSDPDETTYLLSTAANRQQLEQAKREYEAGQWMPVENCEQLDTIGTWQAPTDTIAKGSDSIGR